jgi:hypothetical protein
MRCDGRANCARCARRVRARARLWAVGRGVVAMWIVIGLVTDADRILVKARSAKNVTFQIAFSTAGGDSSLESSMLGEQFAVWRFQIRASVTASGTGRGVTELRDFTFSDRSAAPFHGIWHHVAFHLGIGGARLFITKRQRIAANRLRSGHHAAVCARPQSRQPQRRSQTLWPHR